MTPPKIALIHDYLVQYGGAEKTLETLIEIFPNSDIYTSLYEPQKMPEIISSQRITSIKDTPFGKNPLIRMFPKYFTFLMPWIFESFDLKDYDLIISDGTAWAKSVLTNPNQIHIAYIHTPPRFLYKYTTESQKRDVWYFKPFVAVLDHFLRIWDFAAAQRPDYLLTNSRETKSRIKKFYNREAEVVYPPVDIEAAKKFLQPKPVPVVAQELGLNVPKEFYLALGRLSAYKNFDLIVKAFNRTRLPLVIAGTGHEEEHLREMAEKNIVFTGKATEPQKEWLLANCLGVIFPVEEEDFGIVPVEAMSYGKPVLAHKSGGVLETVEEGKSGMFFENLTEGSLTSKLLEFDKKVKAKEFDQEKITKSVEKFSKETFEIKIKEFVESKLSAK